MSGIETKAFEAELPVRLLQSMGSLLEDRTGDIYEHIRRMNGRLDALESPPPGPGPKFGTCGSCADSDEEIAGTGCFHGKVMCSLHDCWVDPTRDMSARCWRLKRD